MPLLRVLVLTCLLAAGHVEAGQTSADDAAAAVFQEAVQSQQSARFEDAEARYQQFLALKPQSVEALTNLGVVYAALGRYDEAIATYRKALTFEPHSAPILMNLALAYYKAARYAEALPEFERTLAVSPGLYSATVLAADSHLQLGEYGKAIALLRPIAAEHREDQAFNYVMGMALLQDKQQEEGASYLDRILRNGESAESHLLMGLARRAAGDFAGSRDELGKAVALNPDLPLAHSLHGQVLLTTGDREAARAAFLKELAINANDFESNLFLGVILKEDKDYAGARRYLDKALAVRSSDAGAQYQLATLLLATGENEQARERLERIVADAPSFTEAHVSLATVYYRLKRKADGDRHRAIAEKLAAEAQAKQPGAQPVIPQ